MGEAHQMKRWELQQIEIEGVSMPVHEWARFIGIAAETLYSRALYQTDNFNYETAIRYYLSKPKYAKPLPVPAPVGLTSETKRYSIHVHINGLVGITPPFDTLKDASHAARQIANEWQANGLITDQQLSVWRKWVKNEINEIRSHHVLIATQRKEDVKKPKSNDYEYLKAWRAKKKALWPRRLLPFSLITQAAYEICDGLDRKLFPKSEEEHAEQQVVPGLVNSNEEIANENKKKNEDAGNFEKGCHNHIPKN